jgi:hypothetical protein
MWFIAPFPLFVRLRSMLVLLKADSMDPSVPKQLKELVVAVQCCAMLRPSLPRCVLIVLRTTGQDPPAAQRGRGPRDVRPDHPAPERARRCHQGRRTSHTPAHQTPSRLERFPLGGLLCARYVLPALAVPHELQYMRYILRATPMPCVVIFTRVTGDCRRADGRRPAVPFLHHHVHCIRRYLIFHSPFEIGCGCACSLTLGCIYADGKSQGHLHENSVRSTPHTCMRTHARMCVRHHTRACAHMHACGFSWECMYDHTHPRTPIPGRSSALMSWRACCNKRPSGRRSA